MMTDPAGKSRRNLFLGLIFLLALGLRIAYIVSLGNEIVYREPIIDAAAYDHWALAILGNESEKSGAFYQEPFYPYFLAGLYGVFGRNLTAVFVVQAAISAATCLLLFGIGKRAFRDERTGYLAALFWALYKVDFFYCAQLLKASVGIFLAAAALWLVLVLRDRPRLLAAGAAGFMLGLLVLVRGNFMLVSPLVAGWAAVILYRRSGRAALPAIGVTMCALLLAPGAAAIRNSLASGGLVLASSHGGVNFFVGNSRDNDSGAGYSPSFARRYPGRESADFTKEAERRTGHGLSASEANRFWYREGLSEIAADPVKWLRLMGRKAMLTVSCREQADNLSYEFVREKFSFMLRLPFLSYLFAITLGVGGMALALWSRKGGVLFVYSGGYALTLLAFYVTGRYRFPLVPALLLFGAYGAIKVWDAIKERQVNVITVWLIAAGLAAASSYAVRPPQVYDEEFAKLGGAYATEADWDRAVDSYLWALSYNPSMPRVWMAMGVALAEKGELDRSISALQEAVKLEPDNQIARGLLEQVEEMRGGTQRPHQSSDRPIPDRQSEDKP